MTELSPAAQAALDAADEVFAHGGRIRDGFVAALRVIADQVVPTEPLHGGDERWMFERDARQICRRKLLAIAAELEGS